MKQQLKKFITNISKNNILFRKIIRKMLYVYRYITFKIRTIGLKVEDNTIIFSTFNGKSYSCSPKAIYEYMLKEKKYKDYNFIWAFRDTEKYKELEKNRNTKIVKTGSKEYSRGLAEAKYWIFNYKIGEYLYPKKNQVFLQCWHGTPLKRLGCDLIHFDNKLNTMK